MYTTNNHFFLSTNRRFSDIDGLPFIVEQGRRRSILPTETGAGFDGALDLWLISIEQEHSGTFFYGRQYILVHYRYVTNLEAKLFLELTSPAILQLYDSNRVPTRTSPCLPLSTRWWKVQEVRSWSGKGRQKNRVKQIMLSGISRPQPGRPCYLGPCGVRVNAMRFASKTWCRNHAK